MVGVTCAVVDKVNAKFPLKIWTVYTLGLKQKFLHSIWFTEIIMVSGQPSLS